MTETFDWNHSGLNWSHFHSLANILSLRNGGQADPSSLADPVLEENWNSDDDEDGNAPSINTGLADRISSSGHEKLKQKFLDCLAEFAANKQGGTAVACSAMKEGEDNVIVWLSRNEGFSDVDDGPVFDTLAQLLGSLSSNADDELESRLWNEMISYHQSQIEVSYIPNLRASFKAYDAVRMRSNIQNSKNGSASDADLSSLRTLLFDQIPNIKKALEKYTQLVIASYNLRRARHVEQILYSSPGATSKSKGLWVDICRLARLRVAFHNFRDIALTLASFNEVIIVLVPRPAIPSNPSQPPLNLSQTFGILRLDLGLATSQAVVGPKWNVAKIEREFTKRQKQKPNVHAEVQMILFLSATGSSVSGVFPYLGCSKLSCFMCHRFLQSYGRFATRGYHGRLFKPWTVPSADQLMPGQADRIAKALKSVQKEVKKKLKTSVEGHLQQERTSVVGGSSVFSGKQKTRSERQLQIDRLNLKLERDRIVEKFKKRTNDINDSTKDYSTASRDKWVEDECDICSKKTRRRCSVCNKDFFCSEACQEKRSGHHLFGCSKRPLTSADYLWRSLADDLLPEEEEVLEDFGFNNLGSYAEKCYLLGVYGFMRGEVSPEEIHEWRVGGILVDKIKEFYFKIPESHRGEYFPWFLKNTHILERPMTKEEGHDHLVATFFDRAKPYLDIKDREKAPKDLKPDAKRDCYWLLALLLHQGTPHPNDGIYYPFGFATCRGKGEESILVQLYQLLVFKPDELIYYDQMNRQRVGNAGPATFTQFWKAYEARTLNQLIDSKGLQKARDRLPFLEEFLAVKQGGPRPSVWDLMQFLESNEPLQHPPHPTVRVDYGFINCQSFEDTCTLMEIYKSVLKTANPLALHEMCIAGELFQFASIFIKMDERWRPLMKNFYPLEEVTTGPEEAKTGPEESGLDKESAKLPSLLSRLLGR